MGSGDLGIGGFGLRATCIQGTVVEADRQHNGKREMESLFYRLSGSWLSKADLSGGNM